MRRGKRETARRRGEQQMVMSGKGGACWEGMLLTGCNTTGCYMHCALRITPQGSGPLVLLSPLRPFSCLLYTFTMIQIS